MTIQRLSAKTSDVLVKDGIRSRQLVWPRNAPDATVTITEVTMAPGAVSGRHRHPRAEQIWIVSHGEGSLLLDDGRSEPLHAGDVVRTPPDTVHGVANTSTEPFSYLAVTAPPEDFSSAYDPEMGVHGD